MKLEINALNKSLKVFRTFNRLSQARLAERIGVSKSFVSEIESGKRAATLKLVEKYSLEFDVPCSEILSLAEAYENSEYRRSPSNMILGIIDWISSDVNNPDDLQLPKKEGKNTSGGNASAPIGARL